MAYSRIFVNLSQLCSDYARDIRGSAGRGILDIRNGRGRLLLQVQGLKGDKDYRVCLLGDKDCYEIPQRLGVSASGRGELRYELSDASELPEIKAMAVLVKDKAPLVGFVGESYNWQKCLFAKEEKPTEKPVIAAEKLEKNANEDNKERLKAIIAGLERTANEAAAELNGREQERTQQPEGADCIAVHTAFKPFGEDGIVWTKVSLREIASIKPLWKYSSNPFVMSGCRKYKHLLLGSSDGSYILGVPCEYDSKYKLEAQLQGFECFRAEDGRELKEGEICYCLSSRK